MKIREKSALMQPKTCIQDYKLLEARHLRKDELSTASAANEKKIMKTRKNAALLLLLVAVCGNSMAELTLVETKRELRKTTSAQAYLGKNAVYWIQSSPFADNASITIQPFEARGMSGQKNVKLSVLPMIMSPSYRSLHANGILIIYMDYAGKVHASQIDDSLAIVKKTTKLENPSIVNEIISTQEYYVIGGIGNDDFASLVFLDKNLSKQTKINLPVKKKGEVSSLFFDKGRFFAISNHYDASAYLHELSLSGVVRRTTQLRGGAATGVSLENHDFAISYRVGREVFIERFDGEMKSLWIRKLHDVTGIATRKGNLHDMKNEIAWVGANNDKLIVYRLDDNGNIIHTSRDESSGYGVPSSSSYLSIALGRDIHIRGQDRKSGGPVDDLIDSFHFVDSKE